MPFPARGVPPGFGCAQMCSTVTPLTEPLAPMNQIPYNTLLARVDIENPVAGPETVRLLMATV